MKIITQIALLWKFFGFFLTPFLRIWHMLAIVLVLAQLIKVARTPLVDSWHIELGLVLVPFVLIFLAVSIHRRGMRYFFPYLWGDLDPLRKDIDKLMQGGIPAPRPKGAGGLPGVIQGVGFICFFMATMLGFTWYLLWHDHTKLSVDFLHWHRYFAYGLAVYAVGHGCMALRHFGAWKKNQAGQKK